MNTRKIAVSLPAMLSAVLLLSLVAGWGMVYIKGEIGVVRSEIDTLRKNQEDIQKVLAGLQSPQPPRQMKQTFQPVELNTEGAPYLGNKDAPVTLLEFTDYQCPYCRRHAINTLPLLIKDYVTSGKLRYVIREMPVADNHPLANKAAEAALCANDQGKYWEMHDKLFEHQDQLQPEALKSHAVSLHLDADRFDRCLDSGEKRLDVLRDIQTGKQAGMRGTPTFFLGQTQLGKDDTFLTTKIIQGAKDYPDFAIVIDELLAGAAKKETPGTVDTTGGT